VSPRPSSRQLPRPAVPSPRRPSRLPPVPRGARPRGRPSPRRPSPAAPCPRPPPSPARLSRGRPAVRSRRAACRCPRGARRPAAAPLVPPRRARFTPAAPAFRRPAPVGFSLPGWGSLLQTPGRGPGPRAATRAGRSTRSCESKVPPFMRASGRPYPFRMSGPVSRRAGGPMPQPLFSRLCATIGADPEPMEGGGRRRRREGIASLLLGLAKSWPAPSPLWAGEGVSPLLSCAGPVFCAGPVAPCHESRVCGDFHPGAVRLGLGRFVPRVAARGPGRFTIERDDAPRVALGPLWASSVIPPRRAYSRCVNIQSSPPGASRLDDAPFRGNAGAGGLAPGRPPPGTDSSSTAFPHRAPAAAPPRWPARSGAPSPRPAKFTAAPPPAPGREPASSIRDSLRLEEVDADLDFRYWGLVLPRVPRARPRLFRGRCPAA